MAAMLRPNEQSGDTRRASANGRGLITVAIPRDGEPAATRRDGRTQSRRLTRRRFRSVNRCSGDPVAVLVVAKDTVAGLAAESASLDKADQ